MNIVKLQDMLRSVPDQALIGYVQQPNGEVPSYLALSELQRRKDMRDKYAQQQAPESSVAEDLEQETAQQDQGGLAMLAKNPDAGAPDSQGIADLPVDESMYQDQNFAAGGIVAFPTGGYVVGEDQDYTDDYRKMREYEEQKALRKKYPSMGKLGEPTVRSPYDDALNYYRNLRNQNALAFDQNPEINDAFRTLQKRKEAWMAGQSDPFTKEPPVGSKFNPTGVFSPEDIVKKSEQRVEGANDPEKKPVEEKKPVTDKKVTKKDTLPPLTDTTVKPATPAETEEEALRKRMALYKEFMGSDEGKKKLQDRLDAMEARAKRQEDLAPWMAITEAGFKTMQGTSPYALANLGAGAEAGIKSYGAAQDKLATLEQQRYALMNDAVKADQAEKQAAVTFGENSYQHQAARDQKERLTNASLQLERDKMKLQEKLKTMEINAKTGKGSNANLKAQADLIVKMNKDIDKELITMAGAPLTNPTLKARYDYLIQMKKDNEAKIKQLLNAPATPAKGGLDLSQYKVVQVDDEE